MESYKSRRERLVLLTKTVTTSKNVATPHVVNSWHEVVGSAASGQNIEHADSEAGKSDIAFLREHITLLHM